MIYGKNRFINKCRGEHLSDKKRVTNGLDSIINGMINVSDSGHNYILEKCFNAYRKKNLYFEESTGIIAKMAENLTIENYGRKRKPTEQDYGYLEDEFLQLEKLYKVSPKNTVKPLALVVSEHTEPLRSKGYIMEYVDGVDLIDYLHDKSIRSPEKDRHILEQIDKTIQDYHSAGLYHSDIHEMNIRVNHNWTAKIFDPMPPYMYGQDRGIGIDDSCVNVLKRLFLEM